MKKIVRNRCFLLAFLTSVAYGAHAQNDPVKFGKVELADLQMKTYGKDTSAAALVLCDFGKADFQYDSEKGFQVRFEHLVRIKILKKAGYDWATGEINLYRSGPQNEEKVSELKGYTYNLVNGQIAKEKLEKEAVFTEKKSESLSVQKFTLPNVREGSVVEYTYTTVSGFLYPFQEWDFQSSIPVLWSEYRAVIPEYFNYRMQSNGYEPFHINTNEQTNTSFTIKNEGGFVSGVSPWSGQSGRQATTYDRVEAQATKYRWVMKDVPAMRPEAYSTTPKDYMSRMEFELASTNYPGQGFKPYSSSWPSVADLLLKSEDFGTQLNRAGFLKEQVAKIKATAKEPAQQAITAYELVRHYMNWNGEKRMFSKDGTKKAFETHTGNSADINLMLVAVLRELGLEAQPVLLSTRDHGRVLPYYSMLSKFNYVIASVAIGDQRMLLDATDAYIAPGLLPTRCLNGIGRFIDATGGDWVNLETKEKAVEMFNAQLALNEDGELTGQMERSRAGYGAWMHRHKIIASGKEKHAETLKKEYSTWEIQKVELLNLEKPNEVLSEKFTVSTSEGGQKAGNAIYLKPMLGEAMKENPFKVTERKYPVDFATPMETTYLSTFTLPAGYKVEESPKNLLLSLPENAGRFMFTVAVNGNTVQVVSKITIRKPVFYAEEYAALREFYNQIVSKHAEQIVLKKG